MPATPFPLHVRVLHAVHAYPPSVGGSERVVARLSTGLVDRGHQVEVTTSAHADRPDQVDGVDVHGFANGPGGWRAYRRFVHQGLAEDRWDVVMTYHSKVWTHLALYPFKKVAPRWVYAPTEFTDVDSLRPRHLVYYQTVEPASLRRAKRVMVLTRADRHRAVELAGEQVLDHTRVVPNGVDVDAWTGGDEGNVRALYRLPDAPLVLYVGGLWPHKEVGTLVEALAGVPEAHLVCAGPTKGRAHEVEARAREAGVSERLHLLGPVEAQHLRQLYHACDVHASASNNEGFGLTFLEAMACAKPVVARSVGVVPELVDQGATVRVAESPETFAKAITSLLGQPAPENVAVARRYDWENVVDQLVDLYQEVAP